MQSTVVTANAGERVTRSLAAIINSVRVDNFTGQWLVVDGMSVFIAPYTYGTVFNVRGLGTLSIGAGAPGAVQQSGASAGETYTVILYNETLTPSPGVNIGPPAPRVFSSNIISTGNVAGTFPIATPGPSAFVGVILQADAANVDSVYMGASNAFAILRARGIAIKPGDTLYVRMSATTPGTALSLTGGAAAGVNDFVRVLYVVS